MFQIPEPKIQSSDPWKWVSTNVGRNIKNAGDLRRWLQGQPNDVWHFAMGSYNWDNGSDVPNWIVRQQSCDEATALLVYFLNCSTDLIGTSRKGLKLAEYIGARFKSGGYKQRKFRSEIPSDALKSEQKSFEQAVSAKGTPDWAIKPSTRLANPKGTVPLTEFKFEAGRPFWRRAPHVAGAPAVPASQSIKEDYVVCLECGASFQILKRHLGLDHDISAEDYKEKWKLSPNQQLVAIGYARKRRALAKRLGLGKRAEDESS